MNVLSHIRNFAELNTPAGDWRPLYDDVQTRGVNYRLASLLLYARGIKTALDAEQPFGIRLVAEPDNKHDPLAIKVVGFWGYNADEEGQEHLGYLPYKMAFAIHRQHGHEAVSARLVDLVLDIDRPSVKIDVLHQI